MRMSGVGIMRWQLLMLNSDKNDSEYMINIYASNYIYP